MGSCARVLSFTSNNSLRNSTFCIFVSQKSTCVYPSASKGDPKSVSIEFVFVAYQCLRRFRDLAVHNLRWCTLNHPRKSAPMFFFWFIHSMQIFHTSLQKEWSANASVNLSYKVPALKSPPMNTNEISSLTTRFVSWLIQSLSIPEITCVFQCTQKGCHAYSVVLLAGSFNVATLIC